MTWVSSVAEAGSDPVVDQHVSDVKIGAPACVLKFPHGPPGFEGFTRSVALAGTSDFLARGALLSPRTGLVWFPGGPILGESYGSLAQFLSWGYGAHDVLTPEPVTTIESSTALACVPSSGYFHLLLESLPALLRVMERGEALDLLLWSAAPGYVRELARLLQQGTDGGVLFASGPVKVRTAQVASVRSVSGHFDDQDLARLRCFGERVTGDRHHTSPTIDFFITRAGSSRALGNEAVVADVLERRGFSVVDPGRLSVPEQMAMFQSARTVVGPHGAGLANLVWCRPGTTVVEVLQPDRNLDCYARLSHLSGLRYRPLQTSARGHVDVSELTAALAG